MIGLNLTNDRTCWRCANHLTNRTLYANHGPLFASPSSVALVVKAALCFPTSTTSRYTLAAMVLSASSLVQSAPSPINLSNLNGGNGFVINGIDAGDRSGRSVSGSGDFNDDGVSDVIIGAFAASQGGSSGAGETYIVFGGSGVGSSGSLNLSALDGSNGFVINGIAAGDVSGWSVSSIEDINGDGVADVLVGAVSADPDGKSSAGESYIIFGGSGVGSSGSLDLSSLDGTNGFVINGIDAYDQSGIAVSGAGDINGDGLEDVIIGANSASPNGISFAGESYIVFGSSGIGSGGSLNLSSLNGTNGFVINGVDTNDQSGRSVSNAGDVNGDGVADVIIGAERANSNGNGFSGESYIVFGGPGIGSVGSLDLSTLDGTNGFIVNGIDANDLSGASVSSAGDVNADGISDFIIGAFGAALNGNGLVGESYIVFGGAGVGSGGILNLSVLDGTNGFVISGIDANDESGNSVATAGDFNGDGVSDVIIGAREASPNGSQEAGESYIIFGNTGIGSSGSLALSTLNGNNGVIINGIDAYDESGASISSAGDFNDDGIDDVIIGARDADPDGKNGAGESYLLFGVEEAPVTPTSEITLVSSCLAGNGRVDLNIVNTQTASSIYRLEFGDLTAREVTVGFEDWGRLPITGRLPNTYPAVVKRDGLVILDTDVTIDCSAALPPISTPEVTIVNACRGTTANKGQVFFQMVNPTAASRPYVIEFENVANRSTTAAAFGQTRRGTTGRPDGTYYYTVRTGSTDIDTGRVTVDCN